MKRSYHINALEAASVRTAVADGRNEEYAEMLAVLPRCGEEETLHRHPLQTIHLEAIDGKLGVMLPDRRLILKPGQSFEIPKNTEHAVYNADEKEIRFKSTLKPALHTEWLAKELVASARRQKSKFMSLLERAYILNQIKGEYYNSGTPVGLQKVMHSLLGALGKMLGLDKKVSPVR